VTAARPPAVLIVEDERIVARDLQQTLCGMGYDAYAIASSAEEAIACAADRCPDVTLMDIRIEGDIDGVQTAELLQERFDVPVVFLTAHSDDATLDRAKRVKPHGYLIKPVRTAELRSALEVCLYRHEIERRLRERERWHSKTLESIADAVVTVDLSGRISFMNPVAEKLTGMSALEAIGRPVREVVKIMTEQGTPSDDSPLSVALRENRPVELLEADLLNHATGALHTISDSAAPVFDAGRRLGAVMVFRDVSEQRKLQKQLELANALASLGTMAAGVAHEVNNPLSVIAANVEILQDEMKIHRAELAPLVGSEKARTRCTEVQQVLADVLRAAEHIERIVADLRTFSRPAPQELGVVEVTKCMRWALRSTAHTLQHRAQVKADLGAVPDIRGDETKLGQVFINLLVNAAYAIEPGDVDQHEVAVRVSTDARGWALIEVRDTGCGIAPEALPRIFDPFFTTRAKDGGTGLGLSICHGIVSALGGELNVESRLGRGSCFSVCLPPAGHDPPQPQMVVTPLATQRRARILVIDDEPMVLRMIERVLRDHEVVTSDSARAALERIQRGERFDIVLTDIAMPTTTGVQFYEALLAHAPDYKRRIIFMCGGASTSAIADFLNSVASPRIDKPFHSHKLRALIAELLAQLEQAE
jgi:two-component system, cell cycle sensor histidine kinase and response regulator CckA